MARWSWKWWQIAALGIVGLITISSIDFAYDRERPLPGGLTGCSSRILTAKSG